jgi:two-component system, chemotaxis family, protein-glutamate methylesterase/glutaminase
MEHELGLSHVVGVGASAGGVDVLLRVVERLPPDVSAAFCIVLHVPPAGPSLLHAILGRRTELPVSVPEDGEPLQRGRIYVAPPDRHLTVSDGRLWLGRGPKENGVRPAVDPMLRSLATAYGERAVAVILSGALGDGSAGAVVVKQAGGAVVVQDPDDATVPSMPESAIAAVGAVDAVLPAGEIGPALARLTDDAPAIRVEVTMSTPGAVEPERPAGPPSGFTCPECNGSLWEFSEGELVRYRCRVGHAYTEDSMVVQQGSAVEAALWPALEMLEERAEFLDRVAGRHGDRRPPLRDRFTAAAGDACQRAELLRTALGIQSEGAHALDLQSEEAAE